MRSFPLCVFALAPACLAAPPLDGRLFASGLNQPVFLTHMPGNAAQLFVVERAGLVRVLDAVTGSIAPTPLLDARSVVRVFGDGGLLGLAFDPQFEATGYVYVYYTCQPDSRGTIARYHVDPATHLADPASARIILKYARPPGGHNGGWLGFSPRDGLLYLAAGDGGTAVDPDPTNASQTITGNIQGKIIRIDPRGDDFPADQDRNYAVPAGNPFVGLPGDDEIWAYGLRNPWRCSFDRVTGDLWIGDVGQADYEEIDVERAGESGGRNYGWRCLEGPRCTGYSDCACPLPGATAPYFVYDHSIGASITGGYVYRGGAIPGLLGWYVFADFQIPKILALSPGPVPTLEDVSADVEPGGTPRVTSPAAFGEDAAGELYFVNFFEGTVVKIVAGAGPCVADFNQDGGVDGSDVEAFYAAWEGAGAGADTNQDGGIDGADVEYFFIRWEAGGCR